MGEIVERVARATCGKLRCLRAQLGIGLCVNADQTNAPCQATRDQLILSGRLAAAQSGIQAMREPTEAMVLALIANAPSVALGSDAFDGQKIWRAGIDEALK